MYATGIDLSETKRFQRLKRFSFSNYLLIQNRLRLVKRRRALLESNSPRNSQPETHRNRWSEEHSAAVISGHETSPFLFSKGQCSGERGSLCSDLRDSRCFPQLALQPRANCVKSL
ncbi:MAG: hypothetical protein QOH71_551 [Blastocatellia bacterium]|nr:hypothetical protein [Blastocatellia bacterium]